MKGPLRHLVPALSSLLLCCSPQHELQDTHCGFRPVPGWAEEFYADVLPNLGLALSAKKADDLGRWVARAQALVAGEATLSEAVADFARWATQSDRDGAGFESLSIRMNDATLRAGLPYYIDGSAAFQPAYPQGSWIFPFRTYRVVRVRTSPQGVQVRWLERLDETNLVSWELGWKKESDPYAVITLDMVRRYWLETLAPELLGKDRAFPWYQSDPIRLELDSELTSLGAPGLLDRYLECRHASPTHCKVLEEKLAPLMEDILARVAEAHEVQHVVDAREPFRPSLIRSASIRLAARRQLGTVVTELSSYLAGIATSPVPQLSLAQLITSSGLYRGSPENIAGREALAHLTHEESEKDLFMLPAEHLRARAREAYFSLLGRPLLAVHLAGGRR